MDRIRAVVYGGLVSLGVFAYLALPLLQELYGDVVYLPVYGGLAILAGAITYGIVRRIQEYSEAQESRATEDNEVLVEGEVYKVRPEDDEDGEEEADGDGPRGPDVDVETEMEQLRENAGGPPGSPGSPGSGTDGGSGRPAADGDASADED